MKNRISDRMTDILWDLYQVKGWTVAMLAEALGTNPRSIRGLFARKGYKLEWWNERELAELHARYLKGEFPATMAASRGRRSADLMDLWKARGWEILPYKPRNTRKGLPKELIDAMYADYQSGMKFHEVEAKHGRRPKTARNLFLYQGLEVRETTGYTKYRTGDGTFAYYIPKTPAEIEALIQASTKIAVPVDLKLEWRKWDLARRADFIARLRARLASPKDRPALPFSANVVPFDYGSEAAWEIVRAKNAGKPSRYAAAKMDIRSQGVIFRGELWFWSNRGAGYFRGEPWTPAHGRPSLHRVLWQEFHGRKLAEGEIVSFRDGNPNNLDPSNLYPRDRNDVCRVNQSAALTRKSREKTALLLNRSQRKQSSHDLVSQLTSH